MNYNEIVHVAVVEKYSTYLGIGASFTGTCKTCLKIELNTRQDLYLFEEYYKNFDELKEAIRRARFGLE